MHRPYEAVVVLGDVGFGNIDVIKALSSTLPPLGQRGSSTGEARTLAYPSATKRFTFFEPFERFTPIERGLLRTFSIDVGVLALWSVGNVERLARHVHAAYAAGVSAWVIFIDTSRGAPAVHDQLEQRARQLLVDLGAAGDDVNVVRGDIADAAAVVPRLLAALDALPVVVAVNDGRRRDVHWPT